ncbi:MAG: RNA 2'-phosphotransferase [Methylococcaceae bacterium]|nr:RNA 2'-phosphotransferase [Methylococcaceae bacterium]
MKSLIQISKFLSLILRHQPETIGLKLDDNGWANIEELIAKTNQKGQRLNRKLLDEVVTTNDKQRFAISDDGLSIRANQGHSLQVDLKLVAKQPPEVLYHGTATRFVTSILETGLQAKSRQQVHLSSDIPTAIKVGKRHGKAIVFTVAAQQMYTDGYLFYLSENQVWLTEKVPSKYLQQNN